MSMQKVITLCFGILVISGVFTLAVVTRPMWMKTREALNSTVYGFDEVQSTNAWNRVMNTIDSSFWLIPAVAVLIVLAFIYMNMQEKEYVGGGYYR